jgi:hypothetical protein
MVGLLALAVRLVFLDHTPYIDELNHALAARSLLDDGTLRINGGAPYSRSWLFTLLVAGMVAIFGDSLVVGRLPAVAAGTVLVVLVFMWTRSVASRPAAWVAALLLCFAPISIYLSQQVRFYTLHALFFWLGAIAVYAAVAGGKRSRTRAALLLAGAAACFVLAFHLQPITAIGILGVCLWVAIDRTPALVHRLRSVRGRWLGFGGALAACAGAIVLVTRGGMVRPAQMFGYVDPWAEHSRDNLRFYHDIFLVQFPTLWTLLPLLFLLAASRHLRPALFAASIFGTAFLFHSLAAWKHERYLFYALPFLFVVVGLGAAVALPWVRSRFEVLLLRAHPTLATPAIVSGLFGLVLVGSALFAAAGNVAASYTYKMLTVPDAEWQMAVAYRGEAGWRIALPQLRPVAAESEVVLASSMLKALYYLDRVDAGLTATEVARSRSRAEFAVARKEAVPVISTAESLGLLVGCFRSGLVIGEQRNWRHSWGVPDATADFIEATLTRVEVPKHSGILAFRWTNGGDSPDPGCRSLLPRTAAAE